MQHTIFKADGRGKTSLDWLESFHSFSFASFQDPERMGFGNLLVVNDDTVSPGHGFPDHPHNNMEIVSIPLSGELIHKDSSGNEHIIRQGEVQIMSAGTGISHSEYNNSSAKPVHFLQIWVQPDERNIQPRYEQKKYDLVNNQWTELAHPKDYGKGVTINQEAYFYLGQFDTETPAEYVLKNDDNGVFIIILSGHAVVEGVSLETMDAIGLEDTDAIPMEIRKKSLMLLIEIPMGESSIPV